MRTPLCLAIVFATALSSLSAQERMLVQQQTTKPAPAQNTSSAQNGKPDPHACQFTLLDGVWHGSCVPSIEDLVSMTIDRAKGITSGIWRKGIDPSRVWSGRMVYSDYTDNVEIEIYDSGQGVLRTDWGWFPVSGFQTSPDSIKFQFDSSTQVAPSELDRQILERASAILSSDEVWNKSDNRKCAPLDTKWSIYCAMQKATREVTGGFHHRRPALEVVRQIVEERSAGRNYHHRLMDYNNDPTTRLADVRSLFVEALARMSK